MRKQLTCIMLIILVIIVFSGCKFLKVQAPTPVYLIAIDTLRADALGVYGGKRPTPFFDEFAKQAVVFDHCFSPASWTVPSMASLFTGLYPFHHGTVKALQEKGQVLSQQTVSSAYTTIAEVMKRAGYQTYGVSGNGHLDEKFGFTQGFDEFVVHPFLSKEAVLSSWQGMAPRVAAEYQFGKGVFAFLFYFDPHHPYTPQEPYISEYYPGYLEPAEAILSRDMLDLMREGFFSDPEKVKLARAMYDSEVASLDAHLREVFAQLPGYDDALVIITADHGEEFMEHEEMIHGTDLMQTQIHVPLMIKLPKNQYAGLHVTEPVSLVDVLPTIAAFVGAPRMGKTDGVNLAPLWTRATPWPARPIFSHIDLPWAHQVAMIQWPKKFIRQASGQRQVYDLVQDPDERQNLIRGEGKKGEYGDEFQMLNQQTEYQVKFKPRVVNDNIPPEMREKLKNLGYLN